MSGGLGFSRGSRGKKRTQKKFLSDRNSSRKKNLRKEVLDKEDRRHFLFWEKEKIQPNGIVENLGHKWSVSKARELRVSDKQGGQSVPIACWRAYRKEQPRPTQIQKLGGGRRKA